MTPLEQSLADDKMRAEIAKLFADKRQITVASILVPFTAAAAMMAAIALLVKLFF